MNSFWRDNRGVLIAGTVSAVLSYIGVEFLHNLPSELSFADAAGTYLPGFLFGAIVLAPRVAAASSRWMRRIACVAAGTLLYYLAVQVGVLLAVSLHFGSSLASTLAAALGAFATCFVALWLIPITLPLEAWRKAGIFGTLGGAIFGISTGADASRLVDAIPIIVGLIIWQAGVGLAIFGYSRSSK
jgi:hypothetical protein